MAHKLSVDTSMRDGLYIAKIHGFPVGRNTPYLFTDAVYTENNSSFPNPIQKTPGMHEISAETEKSLQKAIKKFEETVEGINALEGQRELIRQRLLVSKLLGDIPEKIVEMSYSGYGDSGEIQDCSVDEKDAPEGDRVDEFLWEMLWQQHSGFENNEGGEGTVAWDLIKDEITITHGTHVTETTYETSVL